MDKTFYDVCEGCGEETRVNGDGFCLRCVAEAGANTFDSDEDCEEE